MKKNVLLLLSAMSMPAVLSGCAGGSQEQGATEADSVVAAEVPAAEPADTIGNEIVGVVSDEMMSTVTFVLEDGDTVIFVKGNDFTSDAAIGDRVVVTLDSENGEEEIVSVRKL